MNIGLKIFNLAKKLWPLNRSITGKDYRKSLNILSATCLCDLGPGCLQSLLKSI